jgi:hydrogenase 3 maturation protease
MAEMKTSRSSWRGWLNQTKASLDAGRNKPLRIAILGVGNELNGDDGAGLLAVRVIKRTGLPSDRFLLLETGPAPENFTGPVTRFAPDWVLAIDAARMEAPAGHIEPIELDEIAGASAATHGLPLSIVGRYLGAQTGCKVSILGIQVEQTEFGQPLSPAVRRAALQLGKFLAKFMP